MEDSYYEPAETCTATLKEKGSRFIGEVFRAATEQEAMEAIADVRKREYAATHHCWAYHLWDGGETRFQDDGEPGGSAGQPILRQILGCSLYNTLVVVTRYYGGTRLGVGGLARAYGGAAKMVLEKVKRQEVIQRDWFRVRFAYEDTAQAMYVLARFNIEEGERIYGEDTRLIVGVRSSEATAFIERFIEVLSGRGSIEAYT